MQIKNLISYLEGIAPPSLQESYDNAGLIVGDPSQEITGVICCLDATEGVIEEARKKACNLVVAHHPIIFKGLKRLTGKDYVERTVIKAIKYDIAIYAIHTNLDNVYFNGVNAQIAQRLKLINTEILAPKRNLKVVKTQVPISNADEIREAVLGSGAVLSFSSLGVAAINDRCEGSIELSFIINQHQTHQVLNLLSEVHPGEAPPIQVAAIETPDKRFGSGMVGDLEKPMTEKAFLEFAKKRLKVGVVKYTGLTGRKVKRVALCGGSGGFLLNAAKHSGAQVFITADYKYHEYFDADGQIVIADIGHYESEQFTIDLLQRIISQKFDNFAAHCTKVNTNPVQYL